MSYDELKPKPGIEPPLVNGLTEYGTGAPLPRIGTGVHGENVSTPIPQASAPQKPSREPELSATYRAVKDRDIKAQERGEISPLYDLEREAGQK